MSRVIKVLVSVFLCSLVVAVPSLWAEWVEDGVPVCIESGAQIGPEIISDGAGGSIITWGDNSTQGIVVQRIDASGTPLWTAGGVTIGLGDRNYPQLVSDGAGGAIVTWADGRGTDWDDDIFAQHINSAGVVQWAADGVLLCSDPEDQFWPQLTSDGAGGAIVTWEDIRNGGDYDIYAQHINSAGVVQWAADGVPICTKTGWQRLPELTSDGTGGAIITWGDDRNSNKGIYAQRINASGTVQWITDGTRLSTTTDLHSFPMIISDGTGGAIVTWGDSRNSSRDIYVQRINASGIIQWLADGVPVCTAAEEQKWPELTSDGAGGAIITWIDQRSVVTPDIYAQQIDVLGMVQWIADGVPICTADGSYRPKIASDEAGGAIISWEDYRNSIDPAPDIYAQHIDASGTVQWTADGFPICTADGHQWYHNITSDGMGGAVITWEDTRNGDFWTIDIFAQRTTYVITDAETPVTPHAAYLEQNFPNPFNPSTTIKFGLDKAGPVSLMIYDPAGRLVATIIDKTMAAGHYSETWDGKNANGIEVSSGVYFYKLDTGSITETRKMILLR